MNKHDHERQTTAGQVDRLGTPGMACDLWGGSPLYENEDLKVGRIPTVIPMEQVQETRNCGRAIDRGKEAASRSCEVTYRNPIQGRCGQASVDHHEAVFVHPSRSIGSLRNKWLEQQ